MLNKKLLAGILVILAVLFAQVGNVAAAPRAQDVTPPEITEIQTETDENGLTTVLVTLLLEDQTTQTVRISLEYATQLGLIDPVTGEPVAPEDVPEGTAIDPGEVLEEIPVEEPAEKDNLRLIEESIRFRDQQLPRHRHQDHAIGDGDDRRGG